MFDYKGRLVLLEDSALRKGWFRERESFFFFFMVEEDALISRWLPVQIDAKCRRRHNNHPEGGGKPL